MPGGVAGAQSYMTAPPMPIVVGVQYQMRQYAAFAVLLIWLCRFQIYFEMKSANPLLSMRLLRQLHRFHSDP
ncbi:hypothetical protein R69927_06645 [Paraburkholderia domus]|uniref:Uncharacterized protein n=2 Tax=Paraburkholderia domus TaxID=2793075 RepID=A0A9N8MU95_9BURK|nr:hypothetical protein R70211_03477 [Paraburkholderia domus]CAE6922484.1 hypothetical protein R69927_06645 [Paraburkholderia domus]